MYSIIKVGGRETEREGKWTGSGGREKGRGTHEKRATVTFRDTRTKADARAKAGCEG